MSNGAYMVKIDKAVFDTGPFLHLHEVHALSALEIIQEKNITQEIKNELERHSVPLDKVKSLSIKQLSIRSKNIAKIIIEAREVAKRFHLIVHGTLGILLRAFREKQISKKDAIALVKKLSSESTLFLTSDLVDWILKEIEAYKQ